MRIAMRTFEYHDGPDTVRVNMGDSVSEALIKRLNLEEKEIVRPKEEKKEDED